MRTINDIVIPTEDDFLAELGCELVSDRDLNFHFSLTDTADGIVMVDFNAASRDFSIILRRNDIDQFSLFGENISRIGISQSTVKISWLHADRESILTLDTTPSIRAIINEIGRT